MYGHGLKFKENVTGKSGKFMVQDIREHFNKEHSRSYDGSGDLRFVFYSKRTHEWLKTSLPKKEIRTAVDVGGADVWLIGKLASRIRTIKNAVALDMSDISKKKSLNRIRTSMLDFPLSFVQGDACRLPLQASSIDFLVSTMVMEHIDDHVFLEEIYRVLSPNGTALVTTVIKKKHAWYYLKNEKGESVLDLTHLREYPSLSEIQMMIEKKGFRILQAEASSIKFTLLTPLLKLLSRINGLPFLFRFPSTRFGIFLRLLTRVPVPGYYSAEMIFTKKVGTTT
jgi:ubiquinone/menaquinone biosynthesis C-methylase UbiE